MRNIEAVLFTDNCHLVMMFLDFIGMCRVSCTSKSLHQYASSEYHWHNLALRRWNIIFSMKRILGAETWKIAYYIMSFRQRLPKGLYTEKYNKVFGRGRSNGVDSWILLGHRSDSFNPPLTWNGEQMTSLEIRVCIQNILYSKLKLNISNSIKVVIYNEHSELYEIVIKETSIRALNGIRTSLISEDEIELNPSDFIVISIIVVLHPSMHSEPEFLVRAHSVSVECEGTSPTFPFNKKSIQSVSYFVEESEVWDAYFELPGGLVVLRDNSRSNYSV